MSNSDLIACERDKADDDRIAWMQCADKWQGRALDAENDLEALRVKINTAVSDFERAGDRELLLDRLHRLSA